MRFLLFLRGEENVARVRAAPDFARPIELSALALNLTLEELVVHSHRDIP